MHLKKPESHNPHFAKCTLSNTISREKIGLDKYDIVWLWLNVNSPWEFRGLSIKNPTAMCCYMGYHSSSLPSLTSHVWRLLHTSGDLESPSLMIHGLWLLYVVVMILYEKQQHSWSYTTIIPQRCSLKKCQRKSSLENCPLLSKSPFEPSVWHNHLSHDTKTDRLLLHGEFQIARRIGHTTTVSA